MKHTVFISIACFLFIAGYYLYQEARFSDGKLHLIFCDVGQGDGIFIRTPQGQDIIIDGGPNDKILDCIARHTPFWDRTIELIILTHPHQDHMAGLLPVLKNYTVLKFATEKLFNNSQTFQVLLATLKEKKNITQLTLSGGDAFSIENDLKLTMAGPTQEFLEKTSPHGRIGETKEFGSVETVVEYKKFRALLTGDSQAEELNDSLRYIKSHVDVLQVPHHGSKTGLSDSIIYALSPKLAVISVGAKNRYHHPSQRTLELLKDKSVPIKRTDINGEVEIVTDGKGFYIK